MDSSSSSSDGLLVGHTSNQTPHKDDEGPSDIHNTSAASSLTRRSLFLEGERLDGESVVDPDSSSQSEASFSSDSDVSEESDKNPPHAEDNATQQEEFQDPEPDYGQEDVESSKESEPEQFFDAEGSQPGGSYIEVQPGPTSDPNSNPLSDQISNTAASLSQPFTGAHGSLQLSESYFSNQEVDLSPQRAPSELDNSSVADILSLQIPEFIYLDDPAIPPPNEEMLPQFQNSYSHPQKMPQDYSRDGTISSGPLHFRSPHLMNPGHGPGRSPYPSMTSSNPKYEVPIPTNSDNISTRTVGSFSLPSDSSQPFDTTSRILRDSIPLRDMSHRPFHNMSTISESTFPSSSNLRPPVHQWSPGGSRHFPPSSSSSSSSPSSPPSDPTHPPPLPPRMLPAPEVYYSSIPYSAIGAPLPDSSRAQVLECLLTWRAKYLCMSDADRSLLNRPQTDLSQDGDDESFEIVGKTSPRHAPQLASSNHQILPFPFRSYFAIPLLLIFFAAFAALLWVYKDLDKPEAVFVAIGFWIANLFYAICYNVCMARLSPSPGFSLKHGLVLFVCVVEFSGICYLESSQTELNELSLLIYEISCTVYCLFALALPPFTWYWGLSFGTFLSTSLYILRVQLNGHTAYYRSLHEKDYLSFGDVNYQKAVMPWLDWVALVLFCVTLFVFACIAVCISVGLKFMVVSPLYLKNLVKSFEQAKIQSFRRCVLVFSFLFILVVPTALVLIWIFLDSYINQEVLNNWFPKLTIVPPFAMLFILATFYAIRTTMYFINERYMNFDLGGATYTPLSLPQKLLRSLIVWSGPLIVLFTAWIAYFVVKCVGSSSSSLMPCSFGLDQVLQVYLPLFATLVVVAALSLSHVDNFSLSGIAALFTMLPAIASVALYLSAITFSSNLSVVWEYVLLFVGALFPFAAICFVIFVTVLNPEKQPLITSKQRISRLKLRNSVLFFHFGCLVAGLVLYFAKKSDFQYLGIILTGAPGPFLTILFIIGYYIATVGDYKSPLHIVNSSPTIENLKIITSMDTLDEKNFPRDITFDWISLEALLDSKFAMAYSVRVVPTFDRVFVRDSPGIYHVMCKAVMVHTSTHAEVQTSCNMLHFCIAMSPSNNAMVSVPNMASLLPAPCEFYGHFSVGIRASLSKQAVDISTVIQAVDIDCDSSSVFHSSGNFFLYIRCNTNMASRFRADDNRILCASIVSIGSSLPKLVPGPIDINRPSMFDPYAFVFMEPTLLIPTSKVLSIVKGIVRVSYPSGPILYPGQYSVEYHMGSKLLGVKEVFVKGPVIQAASTVEIPSSSCTLQDVLAKADFKVFSATKNSQILQHGRDGELTVYYSSPNEEREEHLKLDSKRQLGTGKHVIKLAFKDNEQLTAAEKKILVTVYSARPALIEDKSIPLEVFLKLIERSMLESPCTCSIRSKRIVIHKVQSIMNSSLRLKYNLNRELLQKKLQEYPIPSSSTADLDFLLAFQKDAAIKDLGLNLDPAINECLLFHGTTREVVDKIIASYEGIDPTAGKSGLYGYGAYFAENFCKSDQYAKLNSNGRRCMLLCTVLVGYPYLATKQMNDLRREPHRQDLPDLLYDSVLAENGARSSRGQVHREYITYGRNLALPVWLIEYSH